MKNKEKGAEMDEGLVGIEARFMIRRSLTASLATLHHETGHPYASLVIQATELDVSPLLLISNLALHTQNIFEDNRVSLLFDGTETENNPLEGARLTVWGTLERAEAHHPRARFLARHPDATFYADFSDFSFYKLDIQAAHFVAGFGKIVTLGRDDVVLDIPGNHDLYTSEEGILTHMNEDHRDAIQLYATRLLGGQGNDWFLTGCDPEGCDLRAGRTALRLAFPGRADTPSEQREMFVELAQRARANRTAD